MPRSIRSCAALAVASLLAACGSERAVAPAVEQPPSDVMADVVVERVSPDRRSAQFSVTPSGGWFTLGQHAVYFPPNVICDPGQSDYGPESWDAPCATARRPIRIHATIVDDAHQSYIRFSPDLRFAPSANEARWVWLFMQVPRNQVPRNERDGILAQYRILWSPGGAQPAVDESLSDPTLRTFYSRSQQTVFRRIKHFSGYQVSDGRSSGRGNRDD